MSTKTIGVVGGMGMAAGIELEQRLIRILEKTELKENEYPRVVSVHDTRIADRSDFILNNGPNPAPQISEIIDILGSLRVDVIAIPCNTSHSDSILGGIDSEHKHKVVSIIDATLEQISKTIRPGGRVGLLATQGTYASCVYKEALTGASYIYVEPNEESKQKIMNVIYEIKSHGVSTSANNQLHAEFTELAQRCDLIILGCTELSLSSLSNRVKAVDSLEILATAVVSKI